MQSNGLMSRRVCRIVAIAAGVVCLALIVIVVAFPPVATCELTYFDVSNGRIKREWKNFRWAYKTTIEETDYSRLLKKYGVEELPAEWKKAAEKQLGICRLSTRYLCYRYGGVASDANLFARALELTDVSETEAREWISEFRALLQTGTPTQVRQYVNELVRVLSERWE